MMFFPYPPPLPGTGSIVSIPARSRGTNTTSSQTVASMSAQSGARGSVLLAPAASPKCPAITVLLLPRPWLGPGDEASVERADDHDEEDYTQDEGHHDSYRPA